MGKVPHAMALDDVVRKQNNRRKHERCAAAEAEAVYATGILGRFGIGKKDAYVVDLSAGGTLIRTTEKFKSGTKITLTITLEKYEDSLQARGVVRRSFSNPKDGNIYSGVEFTDLNPALQARLRSMCEYFNSQAYKSVRQRLHKDEPWRDMYLK